MLAITASKVARMPDSPISAKQRSALSRRAMLGGLAVTPLTAQAQAWPAPAPTQPNPELTALGARFEQALRNQQAAQRHFNDCEARYLDQCPDVPPELTRIGPLGDHLCSEWSYWTVRELRALLRDADRRADWPAARAMLPIALASEARERHVCRRIGLRAAERTHEAANDALDDLSTLILSASDTPGSRALKGRVVKAWGKPEWWSSGEGHADCHERFAAQVIDAVIGQVP
jgi:hypothetical protein